MHVSLIFLLFFLLIILNVLIFLPYIHAAAEPNAEVSG